MHEKEIVMTDRSLIVMAERGISALRAMVTELAARGYERDPVRCQRLREQLAGVERVRSGVRRRLDTERLAQRLEADLRTQLAGLEEDAAELTSEIAKLRQDAYAG